MHQFPDWRIFFFPRPLGCVPADAHPRGRVVAPARGREKRRAAAHPRAAGTRPGSPDGPAPGSAAARPGERSAPRRDVPRDAETAGAGEPPDRAAVGRLRVTGRGASAPGA